MQCSMAVLQGVGSQALVTEFLIRNSDTLFTDVAGELSDKFSAVILKAVVLNVAESDCLQ